MRVAGVVEAVADNIPRRLDTRRRAAARRSHPTVGRVQSRMDDDPATTARPHPGHDPNGTVGARLPVCYEHAIAGDAGSRARPYVR